ncbi:hypothetical protein DYB28_006388 [Aphanomyces astaci]|uniref:WW domain-containing protein n=1 Tax=Aphanomyces astaci TaxID=112090 RepID=A0A9X8DVJ7_APHAT|nr:hypothetical protein DYB28_006388 [Aphanomyces astaci]
MVAEAIAGRPVEFVESSGKPVRGCVLSYCPEDHTCIVDIGNTISLKIDPKATNAKVLRIVLFRQLKAAQVVYEIGDMHEWVVEDLVGYRLELELSDGPTATGVLRQHDLDLKCSLVRFDNGAKEWLDLSQRRVYLLLSSYDNALASTQAGPPNIPLPLPYSPRKSPRCTWYKEGNHIELYDATGEFQEGAVICSEYDDLAGMLSVANEIRGKFEIAVATQPHKLVLHGFSVLKDIPVDHIVEVYSTTKGGFRRGSILKKAESGRLIPILFEHAASMEWVDLSSQTFKVVCFPDRIRPLSARERERQLSADATTNGVAHKFVRNNPATLNDGATFRFPPLSEGTQIEVYHREKSLYVKNTVVRSVSNRPYVYELHAVTSGSRSVVDLAATRCKVLWKDAVDLDLTSLVAHVIEVFVKEEKRVDAGRICGCNNKSRMLHVRFQDGRKEWVALRARKLKIRLHEAAIVQPLAFTPFVRPLHDNQTASSDDARPKPLQRSHSYSQQIQNPPSPHPIRRSFSSSNMMIVRSPVSQLRRMASVHKSYGDNPPRQQLLRTDSMDSIDAYSIDSARTVESLNEGDMIDTPSSSSDWSMQIDPASNQTYYVHGPSGTSQWHPPPNVDIHALQWIATDDWMDKQKHWVDNHDGRRIRAAPPIGPIQAVRHIRTNTLYN